MANIYLISPIYSQLKILNLLAFIDFEKQNHKKINNKIKHDNFTLTSEAMYFIS
jgi:hypothetical protein